MKQFLLFSIVVFLFMRAGCGKGGRIEYYPPPIVPYIIENGLNTDVHLFIDRRAMRDLAITIPSGGQYKDSWSEEFLFSSSFSAVLTVGEKVIKVCQQVAFPNPSPYDTPCEEVEEYPFNILNAPGKAKKWEQEESDVKKTTYRYRITSADTVLVKKPISKEQPEAATEAVSSTPSS